MSRDWNKEQRQAFSSLGGTVLVSAAAGSGKSSVLVERVINRLCDRENICPADRLMIVTFTRAAASELRHKINRALSERIRKNPSDSFLLKQQRLLSGAVIGTMDSFCGQLVRDNFFLCSVEPDFRILDNAEEKLLMKQATDTVLEKYYAQKSPEFIDLLELFGSDKNDKSLVENIYTCYEYSIAYPNPEKWIDELSKEYDESIPVVDTSSGKALLDDIQLTVSDCIDKYDCAIKNCEEIDVLAEKYIPLFKNERAFCVSLLEKAKAGEWDSLLVALNTSGTQFEGMPKVGKARHTNEGEIAFNLRTSIKSIIIKLAEQLPVIESQHKDDIKRLRPVLECFLDIVKEFADELIELKRDKNAYSFSDISHMALRLLLDENGNRTPLALSFKDFFKEILIDEYQDTNEAQDMLFSAISNEEKNMFIVGDVKQSIYRFRKAMPEIFIRRRSKYPDYDENNESYPAKIILDSNYRSRRNVIDSVNFVFKRIMTQKTGDIEYNEDEYLNFAAKYSGDEPQTEIHLLAKDSEGFSLTEGEHIANEIKKLISSRTQVRDGEGTRDIRYSDICILMRWVKGKGKVLMNELRHCGVPAVCDSNEDFCSLPEVATILSLLRAVDNSLNDVALLSAMFSPIYGFTPDELAEIRLLGKDRHLYPLVKRYSENNEKARRFLESIAMFRKYSVICSAGEMLRRIYEITNYDDIVRALPNGSVRSANLMHLMDYAERFESNGNFGLSNFISFIDRVTQSGSDLEINSAAGDVGNCVRIMTMHKSKGLEFPVVFIADCNNYLIKGENDSENVLLNPKTGMGVKRQDRKKLFRYSTAFYSGTKKANRLDDVAEELRVLYVAMTRAQERLYFVMKNGDSRRSLNINTLAESVLASDKPAPSDIISMANHAKWIITCALYSSGCETLRDMCIYDLSAKTEENTDFIRFKYINENENVTVNEEIEKAQIPELSDEFKQQLEERINYRYPYEALTTVAVKRTASQVNEQTVNTEYFASEKPAFMGKDSFTPAERGTLTHLFMETADFSKAEKSVSDELRRLTEKGVFTSSQANAVNIKWLEGFFSSELYLRMKKSDKVLREQQFTVSLNASFFDSRLQTDEKIVVQGKIDCLFFENGETVIVDYKTDRVKTEQELIDRYLMQMKIYSLAAEQFTGRKVKEVLLYSFALDKEIRCFLT